MGQQRSSDDDVQTSYLESADNYCYMLMARITRLERILDDDCLEVWIGSGV
jgi:hypothetical protein